MPVTRSRHHAAGSLSLAPRGQLAGGDAGAVGVARRYPQPISRLRTPISRRRFEAGARGARRRRSIARSAAASKRMTAASPSEDGPFAYNSRMEEGKQYPILVRTPRNGGPEEQVLLDCNIEAGEGYFGFGGGDHDPSAPPPRLERRPAGLGVLHPQHPRSFATGKDTGEVHRRHRRRRRLVPRFQPPSTIPSMTTTTAPIRVRRHVMGTPQADDEI